MHHGHALYDFQGSWGDGQSNVPKWLLQFLSVDTFHRVTDVRLTHKTKHMPETWTALASLPHLRQLYSDNTTIQSESFRKVRALKKLESIWISNVVFDDASIQSLASLQELRIVVIHQGKLTDSSLEVFARLPNLTALSLEGSFSNEGLVTISEASNLAELSLFGDGSTIDDDGIQHLAKLRKLRSISLDNSKITGDGLRQFASLKSLRKLSVGKTNVTWDDIEFFKKDLRPDVGVHGVYRTNRTQINSTE